LQHWLRQYGREIEEKEKEQFLKNNGGEVDSLAAFIESRGAKAVLVTLWLVADESTQLLMAEFYLLRKENPNMTKAEAMQGAQQAMLSGKLIPTTPEGKRRAEIVHETGVMPKEATLFKYDATKPYAHPYFWAPFVLIGNWR
jgi:CHAT domain-containing protein